MDWQRQRVATPSPSHRIGVGDDFRCSCEGNLERALLTV
jgi:hypothetical protein